ncbi:hypothetical protein BDR26DRAFT_872356 [Obelidium mucronatum]|nr:hypothetical protein BDR26DRAFT_872356 [Obelidium mucronatum]
MPSLFVSNGKHTVAIDIDLDADLTRICRWSLLHMLWLLVLLTQPKGSSAFPQTPLSPSTCLRGRSSLLLSPTTK